MKIRRVDITGFKSFMDKTVFAFHDGVTGVVGPNGCGKSNLVDAIRWAMGEQSAKHLRGASMGDVIFNGSETRPPLGMAEVSVTFENDGRAIPPQYAGFPEITITRRLFRDGTSDYLINRTPCRLMDVNDLFLGSGVGTRAYSIIEQGRVGLIISARPEDRRAIIEEAAGITRYKARRKLAERKMEQTEGNLLRVSDVVGEVKGRLESLQRQAKKAERFKKLRAEEKKIELRAAAHRWLELSAAAAARRAEAEAAGAQATDLSNELSAREAELEAERLDLLGEEKSLQELQARAHDLDKRVELASQAIEHLAHEREGLLQRGRQAADEVEVLRARLAHADREREEIERARQEMEAGAVAHAEAVRAGEARLGEAQAGIVAIETRAEQERRSAMEAHARLSHHRSSLEGMERRRQDVEALLARKVAEADSFDERLRALEAEADGQLARLGETRQLRMTLEERRGDSSGRLAVARGTLGEAEAQLLALKGDLSARRSRLESLEKIQESYEGYGAGVKELMLSGGHAGVLGLVAELLTVPAEHEAALEAALGERLQYALVASHGDAVAAMRELKSGRASFLPLEPRGRGPAFVPAALHEAGAVRAPGATPGSGVAPVRVTAAIDVVSFDPAHRAAVEHLLGDVWLVDSMETALGLYEAGARGTFATAAGGVLADDGVMTGGAALADTSAGLLHRHREIEELRVEVARLEGAAQEAQARHLGLQKEIALLDEEVRALGQEGHREDLNLVRQEKELARLSDEAARARAGAEAARTESWAHARALEALAAESQAAAEAATQAEGERASGEEKLGALKLEADAARAAMQRIADEVTSLRVKAAQAEERRRALEEGVRRTEREKQELHERVSRLLEATDDAERKAEELVRAQTESRRELERLLAEGEAVRARLSEARAMYEARLGMAREVEAANKALRARIEEAQARHGAAQLAAREVELEVAHLESAALERFVGALSLAEEAARRREAGEQAPGEEEAQRLLELRESIARIGEVNLSAIEEAQELQQRYDFLTAQKKDLEDTLAQLKSAIARINRASRERFLETFEKVDQKFRQVFPRLFRGGRAQLVLTEPAEGAEAGDAAEAGVEIVAQPPGKKLQNITAMSGGEKALTAVSLIFAIFLIKPTPFCLLDEVDAPLDDANVDRYNDMVREMSRVSQFILITHNKRTMEVSDSLYGVTMQEPGVSKVVSVKLNEAPSPSEDARAA